MINLKIKKTAKIFNWILDIKCILYNTTYSPGNWNTTIYKDVDEPQNHNVEWKKPDTKEQIHVWCWGSGQWLPLGRQYID